MKKLPSLIKSRSDKRSYLFKQLPNKLKCLLISDSEADRSAASVNVNVGSLLDPLEFLGIAHFCEHMLFMGTEKYPSENDFMEFLNKNSGSSNAFTDLDATNYYFEVANDQFVASIDRFSYFFKKPLFLETAVEKEINAVDSENKKNLQNDVWRFQQLQRSETNEKSIFNKFSTGNLETLSKPGIRNALIEFHSKYYSANVMNLVLISNLELDTLEKLADENFSDVKNFEPIIPSFTETHAYDSTNLGFLYKIVPVKEKDELRVYWFINEDTSKYYKSNPLSYFSSLFGHEGPNSLLSSLIDEDLVTGLLSGYDELCKSYSKFYIVVSLTKLGLKEWEKVYQRILYFVRKIQNVGVNKRFFNEVQEIKKIKFDFKNKEDPMSYCSDLAYNLKTYEPEDILTGPYLLENYDQELYERILRSLTLENSNVYLITKQFTEDCANTEKWYGTKYYKEKIPQHLVDFNSKIDTNTAICSKNLDYPPENKFIAKNLEILNQTENLPKFPQLILNNEDSEVWYKQDNVFLLPKASISLQIYLDKSFINNSEFELLESIWQSIFENDLREITYMASEANLHSKLFFNYEGICLTVNGFNSSFKPFLIELSKLFRELGTEGKINKFKTQVEKITKELKNFYYSNAYSQAMSYLDFLVREPSVDPSEKLRLLEKVVSFEKLESFVKNYLSRSKFSWLIQGNITKEESLEIIDSVQKIIKTEILPEDETQITRVSQIPENTNYYFVLPSLNKNDLNSANLTYYQFGNLNYEGQCTALVLESLLREKFFDELRTKQQLGYISSLFFREMRNVYGFLCLVQGSVKSPEFVKNQISKFFEEQAKILKELSDEDFKTNVNSVITEKKQKDLKLGDEVSRNFKQVKCKDYDFEIKEKQIRILEKLEKSSVINFFEEHFIRNRKILDVQILANNHEEENKLNEIEVNEKAKNENLKRIKVHSLTDFKRRVSLFPDFYTKAK